MESTIDDTTSATSARDRYVAANGLRFHIRAWGAGDRPALLILHGLSGHSWEWDAVAAGLADRFHVLAVDQRGHGASAWAAMYAPARMADDIAAIASAIELERVRVVGHSMGGINAYLCAARHPALIDALVVVDVGPDSLTSAWAMANLAPLLRAWAEASFSDPDEAVATYLAGETGPHDEELRRFVLHNLRQRPDGRWTWRFDTAGLQSFLTNAPDPDAQWAALRQVACPALVVRGALSEVLSAPTAARMRQELPRGRLVEIADAGHDVHIEQRAALLAEAGAFLAAG